jgi:hypothetical protein
MMKQKTRVLPVSVDEAEAIAAIVRQADVDEITEALGIPMAHALRMCFGGSLKASKIVVGDQIVAVFGDCIHDRQIGVPWLISTIHVERRAKGFLKVCKPEVQEMLTRHERLMNYVDARNTQAIRWLKWLDFQFGDSIPYGPKGFPFYPFTLERDCG